MTKPTTPRRPRAMARVALALALFSVPGCGDDARPKDASPIVAPDSEPGKKAIAETENLLRLRKRQEESSRRQPKGLPVDG